MPQKNITDSLETDRVPAKLRFWNYREMGLLAQRARKFKKVQAKKVMKSNKSFIREIAFFGRFKLFPSTKIDFRPFL